VALVSPGVAWAVAVACGELGVDWLTIFGLGVGSYYLGRSHPEVLINMFPSWALSIVLLVVAIARAVPRRPRRLPSPAEALCLIAFGVLACSLAQTPSPVAEAERLMERREPIYVTGAGEGFVAERTSHGERVLILSELGHHVALDVGVVDVSRFTGQSAMPTVEQVEEAVADLRQAGGHKIFVPGAREWSGIPAILHRLGFRRVAVDERTGTLEYADV